MRCHRSGVSVLLALGAAVALGACGSTGTTPTPAPTSPAILGPTPPPVSINAAFCQQAATLVAQFAPIAAAFSNPSPIPDSRIAFVKQAVAAAAATIDRLDGVAPLTISSLFHTLRQAYDQANTHAQAATTVAALNSAFSVLSDPGVEPANTAVSDYIQNSCGVTPPASTPSAAVATPVSAPVGVVPCPVLTPTGQHTLGSPGGPGSGQHQAGLDFCGGGSATIPTGTTRFTTAAGWGLGITDSCLVGTSGQAGMNTVLTVTEIIPGGGKGPDSATEAGDWVDSGTVLMATGGNFQLQVTTVSPSCVWHITVYPT
jgi:hypothetical protein